MEINSQTNPLRPQFCVELSFLYPNLLVSTQKLTLSNTQVIITSSDKASAKQREGEENK
jgi:hypothetical protein